MFFKSIKNGSKFLWLLLSVEASRRNTSEYIECQGEFGISWQFKFYFLITILFKK